MPSALELGIDVGVEYIRDRLWIIDAASECDEVRIVVLLRLLRGLLRLR